MTGNHGCRNNTHHLLGIVQPMSDAEQGRRHELQLLKPHLGRMRMRFPACVQYENRESQCHYHANQRSQKNKSRNLQYNIQLYRAETTGHDSRTGKTTNQRMGRGRRNTFPPCKQIPYNSGNHTRQDNRQSDIFLHDRLRYGIGYPETTDNIFGNEESHKIESGSPQHSLKRSQHLSRHNGSNRIGCIMKPIDIVEQERQYNDNQ